MQFKKYFYEQFKEQIEEENQKYEAHNEKQKVQERKCTHSKAILMDKEIRCQCGASWQGPRIGELYNLLTRVKI